MVSSLELDHDLNIENKLILVTGASSGIGAAAAMDFAKQGANLVLVARSGERLKKVADEIAAFGRRVKYYSVDLSVPDQVRDFAQDMQSDQGTPDVILHAAGAGRWLATSDTSMDEFRGMIDLPYLAAAYITQAFLPEMLKRKSGTIAFVTSPASWLVWPDAAGYIAARHALKGFAEALRTEVSPEGINISLVTLGTVASPYWEHNPGSRDKLPKPIPYFMPELTTKQASDTVIQAIVKERKRVFKPGIFRLLAALDGLLPGNIIR